MPSRQYLITPGPTPIPPEVTAAMSAPMMHHRSPDFKELFEHTLAGLSRVYQTDGDVLVLAGSGTAGMESAVLNLSAPGDRVVVASAGNFGERWAEDVRAPRSAASTSPWSGVSGWIRRRSAWRLPGHRRCT